MKLNGYDVWAHFAPMFHLVDVFAVYAITLVGGRHVILPTFTATDALLMLERECVSVANVASTMISMLVNNPLIDHLDLSSLRVLSCGGSPQSPATIARAIAVFGCQFFVSYGMTECCGKISMSILPEDCSRLSPAQQFNLICTSGRPFIMIDVRVVDEEGMDVPKDDSTAGEVLVRGPTVFTGYRRLEGPEGAIGEYFENGWFRTGDLAVARHDGYIRVVDRKKDMLLVGGENVYTTEVEAVLHAHPAVHHAAVFGVENRIMGELVAAAVTVTPGLEINERLLIGWCRERLAEYKVPTAVHFLDVMPSTATGKPLKSALRRLFGSAAGQTGMVTQGRMFGIEGGAQTAEFPPEPPVLVRQTLPMGIHSAAELVAQWCGDISVVTLSSNFGNIAAGGYEVLPDATYVLLADTADAIAAGVCLLAEHGVTHVAVVTLDPPLPHHLEDLPGGKMLEVIVLHVSGNALQGEESQVVRTALGAARAILPPFVAVVHDPSAVTAAEALIQPEALHGSTVEPFPMVVDKQSAISAVIIDAIRSLVDSEAAEQAAEGQPLMASGVTSTLAVQLVSSLEASLGRQLPGTLVFDYPTLPELAEYLSAGAMPTASLPSSPLKLAQAPLAEMPALATPSPADQPTSLQTSQSILHTVLHAVANVVGVEFGSLQAGAPLMASGVTSTLAVQLVSILEGALGMDLPPTLVFDYPSAEAIASYLMEPSAKMVAVPMEPPRTKEIAPLATNKRVPWVITAGEHLVSGGDLERTPLRGNDRIVCVPLERWDVDVPPADAPMEMNLQFGSFLPNVADFDAAGFGISPAEALLMDPQQRLTLECFGRAAAAHAGCMATHDGLPRAIGVFVGVSQLDYARIAYETGSALNTYYATGAHLSVTAGRLAYTFALRGPAAAVDTACSSSLVTTHFAVRALDGGDCMVACSLGVNLTLVHSWTRACLRAGMLADDGRCKTLDAHADGYVRAEAVGALMITDGSPENGNTKDWSAPLAVLSGSAVNEDGRSSSLTAPNGPAQQAVMVAALRAAEASGPEVASLEMHGTGTSLGDPIEVGAAIAALIRPETGVQRPWPLLLSTAKSIVGHAEPGAGVAGLVHLAFTLGGQLADPLIQLRSLNSYVGNAVSAAAAHGVGSAISAPRQLGSAPSCRSDVMGGISSFAFQGTNAHAVLRVSGDVTLGFSFPQAPLVNRSQAASNARFWVLPPAHPLTSVVNVRLKGFDAMAEYACDLSAPRLARLRDYRIGGCELLCPLASLEAALGAATAAMLETTGVDRAPTLALHQCAITQLSDFPVSAILRCSMRVASGEFVVSIERGSRHRDGGRQLATGGIAAVARKFDSNFPFSGDRPSGSSGLKKGADVSRVLLSSAQLFPPKITAFAALESSELSWTDGFLVPPDMGEAVMVLGGVMNRESGDVVMAAVDAFMSQSKEEQYWRGGQGNGMHGSLGFTGRLSIVSGHESNFAEWDGLYLKRVSEFGVGPGGEVPLFSRTAASQASRLPKRASAVSKQHASSSSVQAFVEGEVTGAIAQVIGAAVSMDQPLMDAGLDSLGAVELATLLTQSLGVQVHSTLVFDYPTAGAVIRHLTVEVAAASLDAAAVEEEYEEQGPMGSWLAGHLGTYRDMPERRPLPIIASAAAPMVGDDFAFERGFLMPFRGGFDRIVSIPLARWDVDIAEQLAGDSHTIPIHVRSLWLPKKSIFRHI